MKISLKHRLTACLLAAMLLLTLLPTSAWAADIIDSGTCGEEVTWTLDSAGTLTISGTGEMSWDGNNAPWGKYYQDIWRVNIQNGVTNVHYNAFNNFSALTSVSLPNTILTIETAAFQNCMALTSISIPSSVIKIGNLAFKGCGNLRSITIPNGVTCIENDTFNGCSKLSKVSLPEGLTEIGLQAFNDCSSLTSITIPDSVTSIWGTAFQSCSSLSHVDLPKSLTKICSWTFNNCTSLYNICIPTGVTSIGPYAFKNTALTSIYIPDGVAGIGERAFLYCPNLKGVRIPTSVTSIEDEAFYACAALTDVYYGGYEIQWNAIDVGKNNDNLLNATRHYNWTTQSIPVTPVAPKVSSSIVTSTGKIKLTWSAVDGAAKYYIYRSTDGGKTYKYYDSSTKTTYTNTSVTPGTKYYYKLKSVSATGEKSAYSNAVYRTADCAKPSLSSSIVTSSGAIKLSWDKVTGAAKYYIYRSTDGGKTYKYYTSTTSTSWTNKSVTPGTKYYYKIKAICSNTEGNSAYSNVVYRTADCAKPSLSSSIVSSSGAIKLSWSKVTGATKYYIYRSTDGGKTYSYYTSTTSTSWTNKSVTPGKTYYYKIKAICSNTEGNSAYSNVVSRTADCAKPVVTIQLNSGKPQLKWSAVTGASKYYIYRSTDGGKTYSCFTTVTATSWTNKSAKSGTTYYYKVKAVCAKSSYGNSAYSNIVSIKSK